jgi:hypothetical protein
MFSIEGELVMAIHEKGDGLLPFEWHSEGYHLTHSCWIAVYTGQLAWAVWHYRPFDQC